MPRVDIAKLFAKLFGFNKAEVLQARRCAPPPIGCGQPVSFPDDDPSYEKEYQISCLCRDCQDAVFGVMEKLEGQLENGN